MRENVLKLQAFFPRRILLFLHPSPLALRVQLDRPSCGLSSDGRSAESELDGCALLLLVRRWCSAFRFGIVDQWVPRCNNFNLAKYLGEGTSRRSRGEILCFCFLGKDAAADHVVDGYPQRLRPVVWRCTSDRLTLARRSVWHCPWSRIVRTHLNPQIPHFCLFSASANGSVSAPSPSTQSMPHHRSATPS